MLRSLSVHLRSAGPRGGTHGNGRGLASGLTEYMYVPRGNQAPRFITAAQSTSPAQLAASQPGIAAEEYDRDSEAIIPQVRAVGERQQQAMSNITFLRQLDIRDLALISHQRITLRPGLNVISGESGAGKSVLIQALGAVLGAPAVEDCVRAGAPAHAAVIEGTLQLSPAAEVATSKLLDSLKLPRRAFPVVGADSAAELHIRREIRQEGGAMRSKCVVNGAHTSLRVVRELANLLVDVNGQNAALSLRDSDTQTALLDRIAGTTAAAAAFGQKLQRRRDLRSQLAAINELGDENRREELQALVD
eukprot:CAMPEP_0206146770 /NCGR_PEP_ID=MMETSP1473-20131121/31382_1 /ASSEMBLY_ACC=CAM_ASM_001109 /TAXON_ID=1461547 /ORGANISM="Stichococcus sp, Strain RCC1054" /LENGTH=304 /DNA_ID=CAMNT_0053543455 /DNA_START=162 /DNA_END=1073 /DNA_ORIENTATION=+